MSLFPLPEERVVLTADETADPIVVACGEEAQPKNAETEAPICINLKDRWEPGQAAVFLWTTQEQLDKSATTGLPLGIALTSTNDMRATVRKRRNAHTHPLRFLRVYEAASYAEARQLERTLHMALVRANGRAVPEFFRLGVSLVDEQAHALGLTDALGEPEESVAA